MRARAKRLPRLWCALQGLLPLEAGWVGQPGVAVERLAQWDRQAHMVAPPFAERAVAVTAEGRESR